MSDTFRVGLTRNLLGNDGETPVFHPAAFEVLRAEQTLALEYLAAAADEVTQERAARHGMAGGPS